MKKLKKFLLISILALGFNSISRADFSFKGYTFNSQPILAANQVSDEKYVSVVFSGNDEKVVKSINDKINKRLQEVLKKSDRAAVQITANNSKFLSVVIVSAILNKETNEEEYAYKGLVFDVETGKELKLDDLVYDYKNTLKSPLNNRIKQFGINTVDKFKNLDALSSFYLEEDVLVLVFDKGKATNDYDGVLFIPFYLINLQEILK